MGFVARCPPGVTPIYSIESVMHVVVMPGNLLGRADLQLGNAKAGTLRMIGATLHLVERARILHCFHLFLHRRERTAILHAARLCARTAACGLRYPSDIEGKE